MSRMVRRVNGPGPGRKTYDARVAGRRHRPVRAARAVLEEHGKKSVAVTLPMASPYWGPVDWTSASTRCDMASRRRSPKGCAERQLRLITSQ
jgi:hypothetical protein